MESLESLESMQAWDAVYSGLSYIFTSWERPSGATESCKTSRLPGYNLGERQDTNSGDIWDKPCNFLSIRLGPGHGASWAIDNTKSKSHVHSHVGSREQRDLSGAYSREENITVPSHHGPTQGRGDCWDNDNHLFSDLHRLETLLSSNRALKLTPISQEKCV